MAAWIKIETTTPDKPEVVRMAAALRIDQDAVVGKLVRLWAWADANTVDGANVGVTLAFVDRITAQKGFARAMQAVGWLTGTDGELHFPGFDRHNGNTAKARAETNRRVADHRERNKQPVTNVTAKPLHDALQEPLPEKEKEKELTHTPPASGEACDNLRWAEIIRAAYGHGHRQDGHSIVLQEIMSDLERGQGPEEMLRKVTECSHHIELSCGWQNVMAPFALKFFSERQWQSPDVFRGRGQPFKQAAKPNTRAQDATLAAARDKGTDAARGARLPGVLDEPETPQIPTSP